MIIGPKFKIAKRLGAPIFEKTQTQKFELSLARSSKNKRGFRHSQMSDYKIQLLEKQKMRFTYGISEKQLRRYVKESVKKSHRPIELLMIRLESRLDNVVYRLGIAKTRRLARQIVSHGHICVNGKRMTVPSHKVKINDVVSVREESKKSVLFTSLKENYESVALPAWLTFEINNLSGTVEKLPMYNQSESLFDPKQVMEYYSR